MANFMYFVFAWVFLTPYASAKDFTKYVKLFVGTEGPIAGSAYNSGNIFPGATLPFGAVKVGIDTSR
jgi:putative alpha-1,2-mannosidase